MTGANLFSVTLATADFVDGAAAIAAGWATTGSNGTLAVGDNTVTWPAGTKHYTATSTSVAASNNLYDSPEIPVTAGQTYSFGAYIKWVTGTPKGIRVDIRWYTSAHAIISTDGSGSSTTPSSASGAAPVQITKLAKVAPSIAGGQTADAAFARLRIVGVGHISGDVFNFGDLQAEAGSLLSVDIVPPPALPPAGTNLFTTTQMQADYPDRASCLTAGWQETGLNSQINTESNAPGTAWPLGTRHYSNTVITAGNGNVDSPPVRVAPNQPFSAGIYGKWDSINVARNHRVDIRWLDNSLQQISIDVGSSTGSTTATDPIQTKTLNKIAPATAAFAQLRVTIPTAVIDDKFNFSDLQLMQGTTVPSLVDTQPPDTTGSNLLPTAAATANYADGPSAIAAGWSVTPTSNGTLGIGANSETWPASTKHYVATSITSTAGNSNYDSPRVAVTAGSAYSFGFYAKWGNAGAVKNLRCDIRWYDASDVVISTDATGSGTVPAASTSAPTQIVKLNKVAPSIAGGAVSDAAYARIRVVGVAHISGDVFYYSDLQIEAGPTLSGQVIQPPQVTPGNLFSAKIATSDYTAAADALAAGWITTGNNGTLGIGDNTSTWPAGVKHYIGTSTAAVAAPNNYDSPKISVAAGKLYSFGFYAKWGNAGTQKNLRLDIRWFDSTGVVPTGGTIVYTPAAGVAVATNAQAPTQIKVLGLTAPSYAVQVSVRVVGVAHVSGDTFYFSDLQAEQSSTLSAAIVAGGTTGIARKFIWIGGVRTPVVTLSNWDRTTNDSYQAIRDQSYAPVNVLDEAVQAGDISAFTANTVTSWAAVQQAGIDGVPVYVNTTINATGTCRCAPGFGIYTGANGKILKAFAGTLFENKTKSGGSYLGTSLVGSHDMFFGGLGEISSATSAATGEVFKIAGDNIVFHKLRSTKWYGGRYINLVGDNCRGRLMDININSDQGTGNGGFRYMGGTGLRVIDSNCWSGDDVWQCVPSGGLTDPFFDVSTYDCIYIDNTGRSNEARFMVCGQQDANDNQVATMTNNIGSQAKPVRFIRNNGYNGGAAINFANHSSSGAISYVYVEGCTVDGQFPRADLGGQAGATYFRADQLHNAAGTPVSSGGVHHIFITDTEVKNQHKPGIRAQTSFNNVAGGVITDLFFTRTIHEAADNMPTEPIIDLDNTIRRVTMVGGILRKRGGTMTAVRDNSIGSSLDYTVIP